MSRRSSSRPTSARSSPAPPPASPATRSTRSAAGPWGWMSGSHVWWGAFSAVPTRPARPAGRAAGYGEVMTARPGEAKPFRPPAAARESLQGHYAGFASRFASFAVDLVVLTAIFLAVLAAINWAATIVTGRDIAFNRGNIWVVIAYLVWGFIYFAHFWGLNGRTAGAGLFDVQVLSAHGYDVSPRRAALRTLVFPLSFLILGLGFLGILLGDQRRALHDVIAGTVVVYSWDARAARLRFLSRESSPGAGRPASPELPGPPASPG